MRWEKLGRLYAPLPLHPKLVTHAANPTAIHLDADLYRVFFSGRDSENRSSVGYADIDLGKLSVSYVHPEPLFIHGSNGSFYSHGVSIGCCYEAEGHKYLLFMGWQRRPGAHWRGDIGRFRLTKDFSLEIETRPFLDSDLTDPLSLSYPWVMRQNDLYRMWYGSTLTWDAGNDEMLHVINYAISNNGNSWIRCGAAVPYERGIAQAFSRPTVIVDRHGYHMWFSYRSGIPGEKYKIGYAQSSSGDDWDLRLAEAGIDLSESGWDSEMIEYPFVFNHKGDNFMLYNGNGYGKTGFGLAILRD